MRRRRWFVVVATSAGSVAQPVATRAQVCQAIERLAPIVAADATWFMEVR